MLLSSPSLSIAHIPLLPQYQRALDISFNFISLAFCKPYSISYINPLQGLDKSFDNIPENFLTCTLNLLLSNDFEFISFLSLGKIRLLRYGVYFYG